jgi:hypothetical protein
MPSVPNDHARPQTSPGPANVAAVDASLHRWNSTRTSNTNRSSLRHSRPSLQQAPQDVSTLDDSRQSMKALSDFLMTREPPPNNWVSKLSDDERSLNSLKKSAFKLFKNKSKSQKAPRLLQLPDISPYPFPLSMITLSPQESQLCLFKNGLNSFSGVCHQISSQIDRQLPS